MRLLQLEAWFRSNRTPTGSSMAQFLRPSAGWVRAKPRRAAVLLEVVFAISILMVAMAVVGMTFNNSQQVLGLADRMQHSQMLTERLLMELETGRADDTAVLNMNEQDQSNYFGEMAMPAMSYRVEIEPHENIDGLLKIDIYIYEGDPDDDEERKLILLTHHFRANPQGIDFAKDFGLDDEQLEMLSDAIPGGAALFDPEDFDPRDLARMDLDQLMDLLPQIIERFGQFMGGQQLQALRQAAESGDLDALKQLDGGGRRPPPINRRPSQEQAPPTEDEQPPEDTQQEEEPPPQDQDTSEDVPEDTTGDVDSDEVPDDGDSDQIPDDSDGDGIPDDSDTDETPDDGGN